jgi:DnaK suppressor protein
MTRAQRERFRKQLLALHAQLTGKPAEAARVEGERAGTDEDAQPLEEMLQAITSNRNRTHAVVLQRVLKALGKLRDEPDSFGECEECGDALPLGRLEAMPFAEYCVSCQGKRDAPKGQPTRRKPTDYV